MNKKESSSSKSILQSWKVNADAWIKTIENNEIQSRKIITNQAILEAVLKFSPKKILDAGCGEGWLVRTINEKGIKAVGFDGVEKLIQKARELGTGNYFHLSYDNIRNGKNGVLGKYDVIVFNYSIFEKENVDVLLKMLKRNLHSDGVFIIQTISDQNKLFQSRKEDGWMIEDWESISTKYAQPFQWYYRSAKEWKSLFDLVGLELLEKKEIIHPEKNHPFSVIYILKQKS